MSTGLPPFRHWFLVAAQLVFLTAVPLAAWFDPGSGEDLLGLVWMRVGWGLIVVGSVIALFAFTKFGQWITPFPTPRPEGHLVTTGIYRVFRHPMYASFLWALMGMVLALRSLWGLGAWLFLAGFVEVKTRIEEKLLVAHYPEYTEYRKRVKKVLPWIW